MLSRLKRRTPSTSLPASPAVDDPDDTAPAAAPSPASPTSTRSSARSSYTTPVKPERDTLSPTRAYRSPSTSRTGRASRSSSFGSFADDRGAATPYLTDLAHGGNQAGAASARVHDIGQGSLSLDHLAPSASPGHPQKGNLGLVVQAPELLVDSALSAAGSIDGHEHDDNPDTPTYPRADFRTPLAAHEPLFAGSAGEASTHSSPASPAASLSPAAAAPYIAAGRPRSHTSSEAVRTISHPRAPRASENGLDALAAINRGPERASTMAAMGHPDGSALSSSTASPPSMSRVSSRGGGTSRPVSRSGSVNSQQYPDHLSLRPPGAGVRSLSPVRGRKSSPSVSNGAGKGIAGALALSGVALASPSAVLRHPHALVPVGTVDGERMPLSPNGASAAPGPGTPPPASVRTSLESHIASSGGGGAATGANGDDSDGQGSVYPLGGGGGDHGSAFLSMDHLGDFDDVVSLLGTGYAVASSKRNADFHALFKNVPDDDYLIEDYGCALQREILIQGRLYISEHHLSFYANIFGWVTSLVIPFSEVCSIEKRMTAYVIPNAIQVATMHARHTFASFLSRDTTYDLIGNIWRMVHPVIPLSAALPDALSATTSRTGHDGFDSDDEGGALLATGVEAASSEGVGSRAKRRLKGLRRPRGGTGESTQGGKLALEGDGRAAAGGGVNDGDETTDQDVGKKKKKKKGSAAAAHPPTTDTCPTLRGLKEVAMDAQFPGAPEKIYNLMFTSGFMKGFWAENQKLTEIQIGDWAPQASGSNLLARSMSYIKPLNGSIGPRQTKCLITDESAHVDFDDFVCVVTTTRTPDVPSGSAFAVKTRTSMTWARGNHCRVVVTTGVEWSKSSFIKGIIEKSAIDGQKQYHADLEKAMRAYISTHRNEFVEEGQDLDDGASDLDSIDGTAATAAATAEDGVNASVAAELADAAKRTGLLAPVWCALEPVFEHLAHQSAQSLLLGAVVAILVLSNLWTLRGAGADVHPAERARRRAAVGGGGEGSVPYPAPQAAHVEHPQAGSPHEVASAVRDVLHHYFAAQQGLAGPTAVPVAIEEARGPANGVTEPVLSTAEVDALSRELDRIEQRVRALRRELHGARPESE